MKRLTTLILTASIVLGLFMPLSMSLSRAGVIVGEQTVSAQAYYTNPGVSNTSSASTATGAAAVSTNLKANISCGIFGNSSLGGCLEWIFYFLPYTVGGWALDLAAKILDVTASYTLSSKLYSASSFIGDGWRVTRDFSNIFFIFILLAIAISLMLGINMGHANPKKALVTVVLVALLINFSMFFTEVVIDASNTFALLFYNQISVKDKNGVQAVSSDTASISSDTGVPQQPVAASLAEAFTPQAFQSEAFFNNLADKDTKQVPVTTLIGIMLCIGAVYCVAAYCFFVAALAFMGRIVQLMISIIFAPFAMMTLLVPKLESTEGIGWHSWSTTLLSSAFGAPIYFFFILLISVMTQSPFVTQVTNGAASTDSITTLVTIVISFLVLILMLTKATEYAKTSSGKLGEKATEFGTSALKLAGGAALGTAVGVAAFGGQQTVGRLSRKVANSETLKNASLSSNKFTSGFAKRAILTGQAGSKASFDLTNTAAGKSIESKLGIKFKTLPGISAASNAGGIDARTKRKKERDEKFGEALGYNKDVQATLDAAVTSREGTIGSITAEIAQLRNAERAQTAIIAQAATDLAAANAKPSAVLDANQVPINIAAAQNKNNSARLILKDVTDKINKKTKEANDLNIGKKDANGNVFKADQVGTTVTDDEGNTFALSHTDLGLGYQKKLAETNKKARAHAYLHQQMKKTGYKIKGDKKDALGNFENIGYLDMRQTARTWKESFQKVEEDTKKAAGMGLAVGGIAGAIVPGAGAAAGAVIGSTVGILSTLREGFGANLDVSLTRDLPRYIGRQTAQGARATGSAFKSAASQIRTQVKSAFGKPTP